MVKTIKTIFSLAEISLLAAFLFGCATPQSAPVVKNDPARLQTQAQVPVIQAPVIQATVNSAPANAEELDRILAALLPPLVPATVAGAARRGGPRFDLRVSDVPAREVYQSIVSGTRYSLIVHPEISGKISVNLTDVSVEDALYLIREAYGYEYRIDGNRIAILPVSVQTRVFRVNYLTGQRLGTSEISVVSAYAAQAPGSPATRARGRGSWRPDMQGMVSQVRTTTRNDFWTDLDSTLQALIGTAEGRSVVVNPQAGIVVVRAMPGELRQIERYLNAIRDTVQRQVVLEAKIVEVTLNDKFQNGINWGTISSSSSSSSSSSASAPVAGSSIGSLPGGSLFGLALDIQNFEAVLKFLESQGAVRVLSSPRIEALNNQKAVLKMGTDEFFVTSVNAPGDAVAAATGAGGRPFPSISVRPFFNGIALDITPQIGEDSQIILHIHPSVSAVTQADRTLDLGTVFGPVTLPLARSSVSESDSVVRARDSNMVVIGGLTRADAARKELVILLKPTVVRGDKGLAEDPEAAEPRNREPFFRPGN